MLKFVVIATLSIAVLGATLQAGIPALQEELKKIKTNSEQASEFTALLDLQLQQGSKIEEVLTLIQDLSQQLKDDLTSDDIEHATKITEYNLNVETLEHNLGNLNTEKANLNKFIQDATQDLISVGQTIASNTEQLNILNGREEEIRNIRAKENLQYNHQSRTTYNTKVVNALGEILPRLTKAVFDEKDKNGQSLLETKDRQIIVDQIRSELGHDHPIAIMAELTSKFDVGTVTRIIEKLENIRDDIKKSQVQEDEREQNAVTLFQTIIQEVTELRAKLQSDLKSATQTQTKRQNDKVLAQKQLDRVSEDADTTEKLLINTRNQREIYEAGFTNKRQQRTSEIRTVEQALHLVQLQADKVKSL